MLEMEQNAISKTVSPFLNSILKTLTYSPEVPYSSIAVLPSGVHEAAVVVEAQASHVLGDAFKHKLLERRGDGTGEKERLLHTACSTKQMSRGSTHRGGVRGVHHIHSDFLIGCGREGGYGVGGGRVTNFKDNLLSQSAYLLQPQIACQGSPPVC